MSACEYCSRKAKYSYSIRGGSKAKEDQVYVCGYHTWWFGCLMEAKQKDNLNSKYRVTN